MNQPMIEMKSDKIINTAIDVYRSFETAVDGVSDFVEPVSNSNTYQMGVTKLLFDEKENKLHVHVKRPGLLIGKAGNNIKAIENYIKCKIQIHEVKKLWD